MRPTPPHRAARPEGQGRLTAGWQVAPGRAGLRSRAQEVSLSLRQLSPACCGRRLPRRRRRSPIRSRHAVGCMSSNRLYSPLPPAPPSSPPAAVTVPACKLLAGNKRLRSGRAGASPPPSHSTARPPAAHWKCWAGGRLSSPFPRRRAALPLPGSPPGSPGARSGEPRGGGRRRSRGGGREKERPERRGRGRRRGLEAEAAKEGLSSGSGRGSLGAKPPGSNPRPRAPWPEGKPRPREGERRGATRRESPPRRANPLTKESPALLLPARPPAVPAASQPARLRAQSEGE